MKSLLIGLCLVMTGCAVGSGPENDYTEVEVVTTTPPPRPAPTPPVESYPTGQSDCKIDDYWVGNCYVVKIYCKNKPVQTEVACGSGRRLWPWEYIPDPPYDSEF